MQFGIDDYGYYHFEFVNAADVGAIIFGIYSEEEDCFDYSEYVCSSYSGRGDSFQINEWLNSYTWYQMLVWRLPNSGSENFKITFEQIDTGYEFDVEGVSYKITDMPNHKISAIGCSQDLSGFDPDEIRLFDRKYEIESIEPNAFSGCASLSSVKIPDSVKTIKDRAFSDCPSISYAEFPRSLQYISESSFGGVVFFAEDGTTVLEHSCEGIANKRFALIDGKLTCTALGDVFEGAAFDVAGLEFTVTSLGSRKVSLTGYAGHPVTLDVPAFIELSGFEFEVESIGKKAFYQCSSLKSVDLGSTETVLVRAFYGCESLESVNLGSAKILYARAFANCASLSSVDFGSQIFQIGSYAFYGCRSLSALNLPETLVIIKESAFSECAGVSSVTFPEELEVVEMNAFFKLCFYEADGETLLQNTADDLRGKDFSLKDGNLVQVLPVEVGSVFSADGLTYRVVSVDPLEAALAGYETIDQDLVIPVTVKASGKVFSISSVDSKAFYNCSVLTSVDLGSISKVGYKAFANCSSLRTLVVPDTVERFGEYSFYGCKRLTSLEVPGDGAVLEASAFSACVRMKSVSFTGEGAVIERNAFYKNNGVESLDLSNVASVGYKAFPYCKGLTTLTVPGDLGSLGAYAFYSCENLKTLVFEEGFESIGKSAFSECGALESVSFPGSLSSVGKNAFYRIGFYGPEGEKLSPTAESLAGRTFRGIGDRTLGEVCELGSRFSAGGIVYEACSESELSAVGFDKNSSPSALPSSLHRYGQDWTVVSIGSSAFRLCTTMSVLDLSNVESIGAKAFSKCSGLTSVTFSDSLSSLGSNAFYGTLFYDDGSTVPRTVARLAGHTFEGSEGKLYLIS